MPRDDEYFFAADQEKAESSFEHWLENTSAAQEADRSEKVSTEKGTDDSKVTIVTTKEVHHWVRKS